MAGAKPAVSVRIASMNRPTIAERRRRKRRRAVLHRLAGLDANLSASSTATFGASWLVTLNAAPSIEPDPWIQVGVGDVDDQVDEHVADRHHQREGLDDRIVTGWDCLHQ